jgi:hypothetical protein
MDFFVVLLKRVGKLEPAASRFAAQYTACCERILIKESQLCAPSSLPIHPVYHIQCLSVGSIKEILLC